ncbi:mannosyl-3-phosphoglycerate synthase, partial [Chaetomium fimeti]
MSVTVLSSQPRVLYHSLTWPEPPFLQIPSLATATLRTLSALEGSQTKHTPHKSSSMRLTRPSEARRFGLLHVAGEVHHVSEQGRTSGDGGQTGAGEAGMECYSGGTLDTILSEMVIVVPCKDEELSVIRGVISAIPAPCLVILVSNCQRSADDEYAQQVAMVKAFGGERRQLLAIHQKDAAAAAAFRESGMAELCGPDGTIRDGKGEGIILGVALAAALCPGRRYIGFVDADNFRAGSVNEYCLAFAAGFAMSPSRDREDTMVRLKWASKPKLRDNGRVELVKEGRCSRIVNSWLNKLFASGDGHGADGKTGNFITTGNAGEHAMTMGLALKLRMAAGYAIEPYHFVDLLERAHFSVSRVAQG